jgi:hypothetical protein
MRRLTVLSLPRQLVFPGQGIELECTHTSWRSHDIRHNDTQPNRLNCDTQRKSH